MTGVLVTWLSVPLVLGQTSRPATVPDGSPAASDAARYDVRTAKRLTGDWGGVRGPLEDAGIKFSLSYQNQYQQNLRGGLDTHNGHRLSGTYDAILRFNFEKMGLIDGAGFYFKWKASWGDGINNNKVGALSRLRVNSDAGGDHPIFVKKWWYHQKLFEGRMEFRLGRLETVKDLFDVSLYANHEDKDFLNRGTIRNPTIPHTTGTGVFLKITPVEWLYMQAATVDAQSRARRTGFRTAFHNEAWYLGFFEMGVTPQWASGKGPMPGRYRIGLWYNPVSAAVFTNTLGGRLRTRRRGDNVGFYLGFDQLVWKENAVAKDKQGLGVFSRYGLARRDVNRINEAWSLGVSYTGLIPTRDRDVMGFGVSQAILSERLRDELRPRADRGTVYEWYYKIYVTPWFILSPDVQVLTNPGGDKDDRDAVVAGLRLRILF